MENCSSPDLIYRDISPKNYFPFPKPDPVLANLSSGCSVSGLWSFCRSQSPHCVASRLSECPHGARVLQKKKKSFIYLFFYSQKPPDAAPAPRSPGMDVCVLTFLARRTGTLLRVLGVTHDPGTGARVTWDSGTFTELQTLNDIPKRTSAMTGEVSQVKLTLLLCSYASLRVLHVHHDAALPVSLRMNGHLITCKTRRFLVRHGSARGAAWRLWSFPLLTGRSAGIVGSFHRETSFIVVVPVAVGVGGDCSQKP